MRLQTQVLLTSPPLLGDNTQFQKILFPAQGMALKFSLNLKLPSEVLLENDI